MSQFEDPQWWLENLGTRAEIFPHQLDLVNDRVLLVDLPLSVQSDASFLDQRVLTPHSKGYWVTRKQFSDAYKPGLAHAPQMIFHMGHCGSTLLSRLVAAASETIGIREPLPLRTLAQDFADTLDGRAYLTPDDRNTCLMQFLAAYARFDRPSVIKATSICTGLLHQARRAFPAMNNVFIYNPPETHLETLLAGQNVMADLKGFAPLRVQRLRQLTGLDIHLSGLTLGQLAALTWVCEAASVSELLPTHASRILKVNFNRLLETPGAQLTTVISHFGFKAPPEKIMQTVSGSIMQTYSKAQDHQYTADTRAILLAEARQNFAGEIKAGLNWLEKLGSHSPLVSSALSTFV